MKFRKRNRHHPKSRPPPPAFLPSVQLSKCYSPLSPLATISFGRATSYNAYWHWHEQKRHKVAYMEAPTTAAAPLIGSWYLVLIKEPSWSPFRFLCRLTSRYKENKIPLVISQAIQQVTIPFKPTTHCLAAETSHSLHHQPLHAHFDTDAVKLLWTRACP